MFGQESNGRVADYQTAKGYVPYDDGSVAPGTGEQMTRLQAFLDEVAGRIEKAFTKVEQLNYRQLMQLHRLEGAPPQEGKPIRDQVTTLGRTAQPAANDAMQNTIQRLVALAVEIERLQTLQAQAFAFA